MYIWVYKLVCVVVSVYVGVSRRVWTRVYIREMVCVCVFVFRGASGLVCGIPVLTWAQP